MPSNYPGALDTLTNPATSDPMVTPSHAGQHTNANDAIEAIQAELGTDPAGASATVAARLTAMTLGAWTDYPPTWGSTGTAPTLGNGTLAGRYKALDPKTYDISIVLTWGSTSTGGTGQWSFTLPGGVTSAARIQVMPAIIHDSGTAYFSATAWVAASDTKILHVVVADATGTRRAENTVPITYATGDQIIMNGIIEVA